MFDAHCHLLPGVDDGPPTKEAALELATKLYSTGITELATTPHWLHPTIPTTAEAIAEAYATLTEELQRAGIPLSVQLGAENHWSGLQEIDRFLTEVRPLGTSRVVLIELPDDSVPPQTWEMISALIDQHHVPVIAHPERHKTLLSSFSPQIEHQLCQRGGLLQINLPSLLGSGFSGTTRRARSLIKKFPFNTIIASDAHGITKRPPMWHKLPSAYRGLVPPSLRHVEIWGPANKRSSDEANTKAIIQPWPCLDTLDGSGTRRRRSVLHGGTDEPAPITKRHAKNEALAKGNSATEREKHEEVERQEREETERQEREETERQEREETERQEREETERREREQAEHKEQKEAERKEREEAERQEPEQAESQEREQVERQEREQAERQEREATDTEARECLPVPTPIEPDNGNRAEMSSPNEIPKALPDDAESFAIPEEVSAIVNDDTTSCRRLAVGDDAQEGLDPSRWTNDIGHLTEVWQAANARATHQQQTAPELIGLLRQAQALRQQANNAVADGDFDAALSAAQGALDLLVIPDRPLSNSHHPLAVSRLLRLLAQVQLLGEQSHAAIETLRQSRDLCRTIDDRVGQCRSHYELAAAFARTGCYALAVEELEPAIPLVRRLDRDLILLITLSLLGRVQRRAKKIDAAIATMREALLLAEQLDDRHEQLRLRDYLGRMYAQRKNTEEAELMLRTNLDQASDPGDMVHMLSASYHLGRLLSRDKNRLLDAATHLGNATEGYKKLQLEKPDTVLPDTIPRMHLNLGLVLLEGRALSEARFHLQYALFEQRHLDSVSKRAHKILIRILVGLGNVCYSLREIDEAHRHMDQAVQLAQAIGDRDTTTMISAFKKGKTASIHANNNGDDSTDAPDGP